MTSGIPLRKALASLRDELALAQQDRNMILGLRIDAIELDLALELDAEAAVEAEAGVEGKVPWLVVGKAKAKVSGKVSAAHTHRLKLTITPLDLVPAEDSGQGGVGAETIEETGSDIAAAVPTHVKGAPAASSPLVVGDTGLRRDPAANKQD